MARSIRKVLIANRGEIACRIAATCRKLGIASLAVYSDADAEALHVRCCDEAVQIGPADAARSYLKIDTLIKAAVDRGADALHPGYGFLSENPQLSRACGLAGIRFIGPGPEAIEAMGSKIRARRIAERYGLPCVPGYDDEHQDDAALAAASARIGFPLVIKASAGGGGKGIRVVRGKGDFATSLDTVRREAQAVFGDARVLLERFIPEGRHIEVQVVGDEAGNLIHLHDRECSLQRRHQKVIEEAPAPRIAAAARRRMHELSVALARGIGYRSLGTVEFLYDAVSEEFFFLEMNTRIQVEHPVTEMVTGLDLVELQIRIAEGLALPLRQEDVTVSGHAIEARLNAEQPERGFAPSIGYIRGVRSPEAVDPLVRLRFDTGIAAGSVVSPHYDAMLAKVIAWGPEREAARHGLRGALQSMRVDGIATNAAWLQDLLYTSEFQASTARTSFLDSFTPASASTDGKSAAQMLIAAAVHEVLRREHEQCGRGGDDPWASLGAWRLLEPAGEPSRAVLHFEDESGGRDAVTVRGRKAAFRVELAGSELALTARRTPEGLVLRLPDVVVTVAVECSGDSFAVRSAGRRRTLRLLDPAELVAAAGGGEGHGADLAAPIPGLVVEVLVAPGDAVVAGQTLVVLEAMKMMHRLTASGPGTVAAILCKAGEAVEMGRVLVRFHGEAHAGQ